MKAGTLFVVGTPIGNLEDLSPRARRVLGEVDLIACEDTRHTQKLLNHFDIKTKTISCYQHVERARSEKIVSLLGEGKNVALVSDAGMPGVSDPGEVMVRAAIEAGATVVPIPGPSAAFTALAASGLNTERFAFEGFLPNKSGARRAKLEELRNESRTLIFYEGPHRLVAALKDMAEILGARPAAVARELTKIHEEFVRGTLPELAAEFDSRPSIKGEIVIVIEGASEHTAMPETAETLSPEEEVRLLKLEKGISLKKAVKEVARRRKIPSRQLYQKLIHSLESH